MRLMMLLFALVATAALSGCAVEPWVKPYERAALADEVMSSDRHPTFSDYMEHVHNVRESSRGATGAAGGGCGCN